MRHVKPAAVIAMLHAAGPTAERIALIVPVTLITLLVGLLWLVGLACGKDRRQYVKQISDQALGAIVSIWQSTGPPEFSALSSSRRPTAPDAAPPSARP